MKLFRGIALLFVFGLLQTAFLGNFRFFGAAPDLFLILVFAYGSFFGLRQALLLAIAAGIIKDSFSLSPFGFNALLFPLWAFFIHYITKRFSIEDSLACSLTLFPLALLNNIITGFTLVYAGALVPFGIFFRLVVLSSLYTTGVFALLLKFIKKWLGSG